MKKKSLMDFLFPGEKREALTSTSSKEQGRDTLYRVSSTAGVAVDAQTSMTYSAVYTAIRVLAEEFASLPAHIYSNAGGTKKSITDHPLYRLLHIKPNDYQTSFTFKSQMMVSLLQYGNAYAEIEYDTRLNPIGLHVMDPTQVVINKTKDNKLIYLYGNGNDRVELTGARVFHLSLPGKPGQLTGMSPLSQCKEAIGLGMAVEQFGAYFFSNGSNFGGFIQVPDILDEDAYERLKKEIQNSSGVKESNKVKLLEGGAIFNANGIPPEDAQFLQTRRFQLEEIARIYRVPLSFMGDLERSTYNNIEQQDLNFAKHTMRPLCILWEEAINTKLVKPSDQGTIYAKFSLDSLTRGDLKTRYEAYAVGRNAGFLSPNEIRGLEDMELIDGGDNYLVPLNMGVVGADAPKVFVPVNEDKESDTPIDHKEPETKSISVGELRATSQKDFEELFLDMFDRLVRREANDIKRASKKLSNRSEDDFRTWLAEFYKDAPEWMSKAMKPVYSTYMKRQSEISLNEIDGTLDTEDLNLFVKECIDKEITRHIASSNRQIESLLAEDNAEETITTRMDEWSEKRASKKTATELVGLAGAVAILSYRSNGITKKVWRSNSGACPICTQMNGTIVGIDDAFASEGDVLTADGVNDMQIKSTRAHSPLHGGCTCHIEAVKE